MKEPNFPSLHIFYISGLILQHRPRRQLQTPECHHLFVCSMFSHSRTPTGGGGGGGDGGSSISHGRETAARVSVSYRPADFESFFFFFLFWTCRRKASSLELPSYNLFPLWAGLQAELPDNRIILWHFAAGESLLLSSLLAPAEEGVGPRWKLLWDEPGLKGPGRPMPHRRIALWRLCIPHLSPPLSPDVMEK